MLHTPRPSHLTAIIFIALLSIIIYANSLKNGFVYDDDDTVVNSTLIKSLHNLPKLIQKDYFSSAGEMSYRPVVTFTYFIDYVLYGPKPWGYHLTNTLLHAANGVLLYVFLTLLLRQSGVGSRELELPHPSSPVPFFASLFFAAHPVLTEAVNAISFREDLLVFLFYMAALNIYLYLRCSALSSRRIAGIYSLSCILYLLALLSKEMAVTLPLTIICYEWIYGDKKQLKNSPDSVTPSLVERRLGGVIGYIAVTVFYLFLRFYYFYNPAGEKSQRWELTERLLTLPYLILNYIKLTIFPVSLSADYVIKPVLSPVSLSFILPFIALTSILLVSFVLRRKREFIFGTFFFIITLLPVYNLIPIANPFAERYLYLPAAGFVIILLLFDKEGSGEILKYIFSILILSIFALTVVKRNAVWRDRYSLWSDTVRKMPESSRGHNGLGLVYYEQGRFNDAIDEYQTAIRVRPGYAKANNNLGLAYLSLEKFDEAFKFFNIALRLAPANHLIPNNIGNLYYKQGNLDMAIRQYRIAISLNPSYSSAHNNLGKAYADQGRFDEAIREYQAALKLSPDDAVAHNNLGAAFFGQGKTDEAIEEYLASLRLNHEYPEAHNNLGAAYAGQGRLTEAVQEFRTALRLKPDYIDAQNNLGTAYLEQRELSRKKSSHR